jgi:hypothetical protein
MLPIRTASLRQLTRTHTLRLMCSSSTSTSEKKDKASQSDSQSSQEATADSNKNSNATTGKKTMAQVDEELRLKMAGLAGDGGDAGVEFEDGQPVSMKRSVKNNMFRYI